MADRAASAPFAKCHLEKEIHMSRKSIIVASLSAIFLISITSLADAKRARSPSSFDCDVYARNYAQNQRFQGQILGGTAFGSLGGFALGSIWAASGYGAAIGAGIGLIGGLIAQSADTDQIYRTAYQDCMSGAVR
jgi:hypothetical protein